MLVRDVVYPWEDELIQMKRINRLSKNRKGLSGPALIGTFILVFLMVFGLIALYQKVMKGGTKVLDCKANGGDCVPGTCDFSTQIPALSDKAAGCQSGELCCINITKSNVTADPACKGLTWGDSCDKSKLMFCDKALQCVSKCDFCNIYFDRPDKNIVSICNPKKNTATVFETIHKNGKIVSCSCTKAQCDTKTKTGECIPGLCPSSTDASKYACCTTT